MNASLDDAEIRKLFNTRQSVVWYIVLPILLSLFISAMLLLQIRFLLNNSREVVHSQQVLAEINNLQRTIVDMETGLRGYIITGEQVYLEPQLNAKKELPQVIGAMKNLVRDNKFQLESLDNALSRLDEWLAYSDERIANRKRFKTTGILSSAISIKGKNIMDAIRVNLSEMTHEEERLAESRQRQVENNTKVAITVTLVLSFLFSIGLSYALYERLRRQSMMYHGLLSELLDIKKKLQDSNIELERAVEERTAELLASNNELEAFSYSVSHDLRAPLRGIDGFSLALIEDYGDKIDEGGQKYLKYIRQGIQKMGILIDDLLNLSRVTRQDVKKSDIDLTALFFDVSSHIQTVDQEPGELSTTDVFSAEPGLVAYGDEGLVRVVLENLLSNAWKFSRKQVRPQIKLGCKIENGENVFYIQDNGVGFDMRFKDKLFNAFQRLHSAADYKGTGIGLATVKRVILKHGGNIWVDSTLGQGTTFYFTLPNGG